MARVCTTRVINNCLFHTQNRHKIKDIEKFFSTIYSSDVDSGEKLIERKFITASALSYLNFLSQKSRLGMILHIFFVSYMLEVVKVCEKLIYERIWM